MAKEIQPGAAPQGDAPEPFAEVSPVDPNKIKSEAGQDAAPAKGNQQAPQAPENYFNPGAPVIEKQDNPEAAKAEDGSGNPPEPAVEPQTEPEAQPETKEEPEPSEASTETTEGVDWEENYKKLRSKFNQRDEEIKDLRGKVETAEQTPNKSEEFKAELDEAKATLKEYEKWYNENYPVFKKAVEDPQLASKLKEIQKEIAQPLTSDQVRQIAEQAHKDALREAEQSQLIDNFVDSNNKAFSDPLVQDEFQKQIGLYPDGYGFEKQTLEIMFENAKRSVGYKDEPTIPVKDKQAERQKKVADTQVGQGTTSTSPAAPPPNEQQQKESLFEAPPGRVSSSGMFGSLSE